MNTSVKKKITLSIFILLSLILQAKDKSISISKIYAFPAIAVQNPIFVDSFDLSNKRFEETDLLHTYLQLPSQNTDGELIDSFTDILYLEPIQTEYALQFLSFTIKSDCYETIDLNIKATNILEVYAENEKIATKEIKGDNIDKAKEISKEITLLPNENKRILIKILRSNNISTEQIKIQIKSTKDSDISISYNNTRTTKIEDGLQGTRITNISISPLGNYTIIYYKNINEKGEENTFCELFDIKNKKIRSLANTTYKWLPKTNAMYFSKTNTKNQLDLISVNPDNMEEHTLALDIPKGTFVVAPNEKFLIYSDSKDYESRKGDLKLLLSPEDRQDNYLKNDILYKYDLKTGLKEQITFSKSSIYMEDISDDSNKILFSISEEQLTSRPFRNKSVFLYNFATNTLDTIYKNATFIGTSKFSPNAEELITLGGGEAFGGISLNIDSGQTSNIYDTQAFIYKIETKTIKAITKEFNPSIKQAFWSNKDFIYFITADKIYENVYIYNIKKDQFTKLNLKGDLISKISIDLSGNIINYISRGAKTPTEAYSYNQSNNSNQLLVAPMQAKMQTINLGEVHDWKFTASDSTTIDGFYHLPPNFDASKKYPLIIYYYAGTTPTNKTFEHPYSMHYFASLGYVVYTIIPSGSIGYGQKFSAKHVNAWGKQTAEDIIEATENFADTQSFIDKNRIGCVGASYGGFMTMYLLTQTNLFKVAISHAGISSLASYWGEGSWGYTYSAAASANSYPWNNNALYINQSPLFNADKINTPLLLTHGTQDTNVPIGESIQMYTALKILGKPVEFIQVKGENHGIINYKKKIEWTHSMGAWFDKWLKEQPDWWNSMYKMDK